MVHESWLRLVVLTLAMMLTGSMTLPGSGAFPSLEEQGPPGTTKGTAEATTVETVDGVKEATSLGKTSESTDADLKIIAEVDTYERLDLK